jgi:Glycosyltransferase family 87
VTGTPVRSACDRQFTHRQQCIAVASLTVGELQQSHETVLQRAHAVATVSGAAARTRRQEVTDPLSGRRGGAVSAWVWVLVALVWVSLLARILPETDSDRGIFVSVAARLVAGDRLYTEVWDNKEPFFYYVTVPGRIVSPLIDVLIELAWLIVAAVSVYRLVTRESDRRAAVLIAFVLTPIVLTGHNYYPGFTELPGVVVSLAVVSCLRCSRPLAAGALAGILLFLKVVMFPVAIVLAVWVLLLRRDVRGLARFAVGVLASSAVAVLVLLVRGELGPYLHSLRVNVAYAQGPLAQTELPLVGHLIRVFDKRTILEVIVTVAIVLAIVVSAHRRESDLTPSKKELLWLTALSLSGYMLVLAVTGLWSHHALTLHVPAILSAALLAPLLARALERAHSRLQTIGLVGLLAVLVLLFAGLQVPLAVLNSWREAPDVLALDLRTPPEAQRLLTLGTTGSYARLGQSDDQGHAAGVPEWHLSCRRFAQYPFDSKPILDDVLQCAATSPVLLISPSLTPEKDLPEWNQFVADAESLINTRYNCSSADRIRVCTRR